MRVRGRGRWRSCEWGEGRPPGTNSYTPQLPISRRAVKPNSRHNPTSRYFPGVGRNVRCVGKFFLDRPPILCLLLPGGAQPAARNRPREAPGKFPPPGIDRKLRDSARGGRRPPPRLARGVHLLPSPSPDARRRTKNRSSGGGFASDTNAPPTARERPRTGPAPAPVKLTRSHGRRLDEPAGPYLLCPLRPPRPRGRACERKPKAGPRRRGRLSFLTPTRTPALSPTTGPPATPGTSAATVRRRAAICPAGAGRRHSVRSPVPIHDADEQD
jgi:hypothetical protein